MIKKHFYFLIPWLMLLPLGCAGVSVRDLEISSLMQKKRHHEVVRILQPEVDRGAGITSFQLFLLAAAYYEIRDYEKMSAAVVLMEKKIAAGDDRYFIIDLSAYPRILRAMAALDQGEYEKAIAAASGPYEQISRPPVQVNSAYIDVVRTLGIAHAALGRKEKTHAFLDKLFAIETKDTILGPEKFIAIAKIYMALKEYDKALAAIQNPQAKVAGFVTVFYDQTFEELPKFFILTKSLYETGKTAEARDGYDQLLKHPQIQHIGGMYWPVLLDRAKIALQDGQAAAAEALIREAVDVVEKQRSSISTEAGRIGFVGDKQTVYQQLVALLVDRGRPAEAFEYVERSKSRALVDLLASQKDFAVSGRNPAGIRSTLAEMAAAEKALNVVAAAGSVSAPSTRGIVIDLKKNLAAQAPDLASLVTVTGASAGAVRERLAADENLIEYYSCGREWLAFVLSRNEVRAVKLGALDVDGAVREFRAALMDPSSNHYRRFSAELYQKLFEPLAGLVRAGRLIIVPHGALHYLPFGALFSGREYLIDQVKLRVLPAAGVLHFLSDRTSAGDQRMLILANPDLKDPRYDLKYAQEEAQAISRLLPRATVLLRADARAEVISRDAGKYTIIHIAAHGVFNPEYPLNSALLLARGDGDDGLLKAGSLYGLTLNADLVTLSACETALGKITQGDDVIGFTRGFLYAGARSIIATLWKVDDRATMELMTVFYQTLLKADKDEALRTAQLATKSKYPHPFYWASFQLTGNVK